MQESVLPGRIPQLSQHDRRRLIITTALRTCLNVAMLLVIYVLLPVDSMTTSGALVRLVGVFVILGLVVASQVHAITTANFPDLRAIEAIIVAVAVFIVLFALLYIGVGQSSPSNFSEPLDRVSAFYFTVTVLATVGFGDIVARSDLARLIVTVQMLLDLALLAIVVRVFFSVARATHTHA
jgi:hypothetical protein